MSEGFSSGGGRRVLEDPVPLAEDAVTGDEQAAALVALGEKVTDPKSGLEDCMMRALMGLNLGAPKDVGGSVVRLRIFVRD